MPLSYWVINFTYKDSLILQKLDFIISAPQNMQWWCSNVMEPVGLWLSKYVVLIFLWSDYWEIQHNNMKTLFTYSMAITIAICHYFLQLYISSLMLSELITFVSFFLRNLFNFLIIFTKQFLHERSSTSIPCVFRDLYLKWIISSILYSRTYLSIYLWNVYIYICEIICISK